MKLLEFAEKLGLVLEKCIPPFSSEKYGDIQDANGDDSEVPEYLKIGELARGKVYLEKLREGTCMAMIGMGNGIIHVLVDEFPEMALDVRCSVDPREEMEPCLSEDPIQSVKNLIEHFKAPLYC